MEHHPRLLQVSAWHIGMPIIFSFPALPLAARTATYLFASQRNLLNRQLKIGRKAACALITTYERDSIWHNQGLVSVAPPDIGKPPRIPSRSRATVSLPGNRFCRSTPTLAKSARYHPHLATAVASWLSRSVHRSSRFCFTRPELEKNLHAN